MMIRSRGPAQACHRRTPDRKIFPPGQRGSAAPPVYFTRPASQPAMGTGKMNRSAMTTA